MALACSVTARDLKSTRRCVRKANPEVAADTIEEEYIAASAGPHTPCRSEPQRELILAIRRPRAHGLRGAAPPSLAWQSSRHGASDDSCWAMRSSVAAPTPSDPDECFVAVALVRPGVCGAIALAECDRAAARVPAPASGRPGFGGGCWFAGRIQRRQPCVDVDAASPTRQPWKIVTRLLVCARSGSGYREILWLAASVAAALVPADGRR